MELGFIILLVMAALVIAFFAWLFKENKYPIILVGVVFIIASVIHYYNTLPEPLVQ